MALLAVLSGPAGCVVFRFRQRSGHVWLCLYSWGLEEREVCGAHCSFFSQDAGTQVDAELEKPCGSLYPSLMHP